MVFVVNADKQPLSPCTERRARILLERSAARVQRMYPFTIRLVEQRNVENIKPLTLKIDPGSRETGMALVKEEEGSLEVIAFFNIIHRGAQIRKNLEQRANYRRRRRSANLRYREPRFNNRRRPEGWLAPSLKHRVDTTLTWVRRLSALAPISKVWLESVRFDMQKIQNPEISGVEYQRGELFGYEVREYLLEKWGRKCAYCGKENVPLQVEHIQPRASGGTDRVSNLTLACEKCNKKKGSRSVEDFLKGKPTVLARIKSQAMVSLRDAAAVNSVRFALVREIKGIVPDVHCSSGGRTKFNRSRFCIPKEHWLDAMCVGEVGSITPGHEKLPVLHIVCTGRGTYQRARPDRYGFTKWHRGDRERSKDGTPSGHCMRRKMVHGFMTGDMVEAVVTKGKKQGRYEGRVAIRASGSFNIRTADGIIQGIGYKYCRLLSHNDGYGYCWTGGTHGIHASSPS